MTISDQRDPDLDWTTFELADLGFGDTVVPMPLGRTHFVGSVLIAYNGQTFNVEIEAGIDLASGRVFVIFQSISPETSLPPEVLTGFLPPEDGTGHGKGHVNYFTKVRSDRPTGTEIRNVTVIEFDRQQSITTNQRDPQNAAAGTDPDKEALNTIDAGPPASGIAALPAASASPFTVNWSGADDVGGSGIADYDIFVSTNGGPFARWLSRIAGSSVLFHGVPGETYAFYSVARDQVGHSESAPPAADTQTTVTSQAPVEALVAPAGGRGKLPIHLHSSATLANVAMAVSLPPGRLTEPAVELVAPELCTHAVQELGNAVYLLSFQTCPGQTLPPAQGRLIAWLHLDAPAGQGSGFAHVALGGSFGARPDGVLVTNPVSQTIRMMVVGIELMLEAMPGASGLPELTLVALTGTTNTIQSSTNLIAPDARFGNQIAITWPGLIEESVLETTDSLNNADWSVAPEAQVGTEGGVAVPFLPTNAERFFRLRRP